MIESVSEYYDRCAEAEWERLEQDAFHELEFRATMACLRAHLPGTGLVLDAGGGPGRYTRELCRLGYEVVLLDVSDRCLALAREKLEAEEGAVAARLCSTELGDIRDLSRFTDGAFDVVLCGGALPHVLPAGDRETALSELVRIAAPGAPVVISVIGYYAVLRTVLTEAPAELADPERHSFLATGDHSSTGGFPDAHFFRPEELQAAAEAAGLRTVELRACEGLSANLGAATNALREHEDGRWEEWLRVLDATAFDPAVIATSEHFLYVGRAPEG